jgi:hypothetical protein
VDATVRARENRLRRLLKRQGLRLVKSRRRDTRAADHGRYGIIDPAGSPVLISKMGGRYPMTLGDVEEWLTSRGRITAVQDPGHRTADGAYEWTMNPEGGEPVTFRHMAPDPIVHLYQPAAVNEPILVYRGLFHTEPGEPAERAYDGDIRLSWLPTPRIEACGQREAAPEDVEAFFASLNNTSAWQKLPEIHLPEGTGIPCAPSREAPPRSGQPGVNYFGPAVVFPPEIGDGTVLTRVIGLIPNGWDTRSGSLLADPSDRRRTWHGRTTGRGGGWTVTMDATDPDGRVLGELSQRGGYGVTHVISLARADGIRFAAPEATESLRAVRCALALALGRRTDVVLPVGWRDDEPVWARWTAGRVDAYRDDRGSWLDPSITAAQVGETVGRFLDCWPDPLRRDTLRYAVSYYIQALALDPELGTAAAVSGLLLLGRSWLVEDRRVYTGGEWDQMRDAGAGQTETQIRALLESRECRICTALPGDLTYLQGVADRLNTDRAQDEPRDGLGCVITMRNHVIHPTRDRRNRWSYQQWTEARILAVHFLELALLAYVGYCGRYHPRISDNRWLGYTEDVPWTGC